MINRRRKRSKVSDDLDITSFMNLMIILVPVLLINMVFAQITSIDLTLPSIGTVDKDTKIDPIPEIHIKKDNFSLYYPAKNLIEKIEFSGDAEKDFENLSITLRSLKNTLLKKEITTSQILILANKDSDYQTLITTMDKARSYKTVLITDVVDAELFPNISLGQL